MRPRVDPAFFDAGMFIGALLRDDPRNPEAYSLVEAARRGDFAAFTSVGVLSETYAALTWAGSPHPHAPADAARVVAALIEPPSALRVLPDGLEAARLHLQLAGRHRLTARRIHDARHAATALHHGIGSVYTYDPDDWRDFFADGIVIVGPPSTLVRLALPALEGETA
jgi:predicted nucleic acid-binding protein